MNTQLLASIIQGEAGSLGPIGMMAVALSLSCRIWQHGHDESRIAREWYGRAEPGPVATLLAELVAGKELPDNDYYFCMGEGPDVIPRGWPDGDAVVRVGDEGIHLYKEWPEAADLEGGMMGGLQADGPQILPRLMENGMTLKTCTNVRKTLFILLTACGGGLKQHYVTFGKCC